MSYKDYSTEAAKEIMSNIRDSQNTARKSDFGELPQLDHKKNDHKKGLSSNRSHKKIDYEYNRPTTAENNRINETHIFIEKWFESPLNENFMWNTIQRKLDQTFAEKDTSGTVKDDSSKKKWIYNNHSKHEMILTFKKDGRFAHLKVAQRIGSWGPKLDGIVHGSYTSLLIFGLIYAIYQPAIPLSIGIISLLWALSAIIIFRLSISSRRKKHKHLTSFMDNLADFFIHHSENQQL